MPEFPWRLLTVDIDGTLTRVHGWREIARAFGREPDFEATYRRFLRGEIGEDEHLANLLELATGRPVEAVLEVVAQTPKLAGIAEAVRALHDLGARAALLSHNPQYVVDFYRRTFGFDDGDGLAVPVDAGGRIGPPRAVHADKLGGLSRLLGRLRVESRSVAHVGDGWSDAEVFHHVGGGIALNSRLAEVNRAADRALSTDDLRDVVRVLRDLRPRP